MKQWLFRYVFLVLCASALRASVVHPFDAGSEGFQYYASVPQYSGGWSPSGGNPDGYVYDSFDLGSVGAGSLSLSLFGPLGVSSSDYGSVLRFDAAIWFDSPTDLSANHVVTPYSYIRLYHPGSGDVEGYFAPLMLDATAGGPSWTTLSIPLDIGAAWSAGMYPNTAQGLADYLGTNPNLMIIEDVSLGFTHGSQLTLGLDNVSVTGASNSSPAVPEPGTGTCLLIGIAMTVVSWRWRPFNRRICSARDAAI
jgi:hypothetical protein